MDERTVRVTNQLSWLNFVYDPPYTGWRSARFENLGPSAVIIHINNPPHPDYGFMIEPGESKMYDEELIKIIYLRCTPGLKATVRIGGMP